MVWLLCANAHPSLEAVYSETKGFGDCLILQLTGISCNDLHQFRVLGFVLIPDVFFYCTVNNSWNTSLSADLDQNRGQTIKPRALEWLTIFSGLGPSGINSALNTGLTPGSRDPPFLLNPESSPYVMR